MTFTKTLAAMILTAVALQAQGSVEFVSNGIAFDGQVQPQLWSAELQYFRLRGEVGRNIPRAKVLAHWNRALDQAQAAGMNFLSFYIPWDFHEYAEGRFDFNGTVDEDHDGRPDYPARDLAGFLKLIESRGFHGIMVRPGPYINSEWGFTGAGAIPRWLYKKCPDCVTQTSDGKRNRYLDINDPRFLQATQNWFTALYSQVLKTHIGSGKIIRFVQIDNETNYMWQSIYETDYGLRNRERFRHYLKERYGDLASLSRAHEHNYASWSEVAPPFTQFAKAELSRDWYRFLDDQMTEYLANLRAIWTSLGLNEPTVRFTFAESLDANRWDARGRGILPDFRHRNRSGLMTVNLYPLGQFDGETAALGQPFKIDHNVKAVASSTQRSPEWTMAPEIEGCVLWRELENPKASLKQIYLSALGRGLKAMSLFYMHHGFNYEYDWKRKKIAPLFQELKTSSDYAELPEAELPQAFWDELQMRAETAIFVGLGNVRFIWENTDPVHTPDNNFGNVCFEADLTPKPFFEELLVKIGTKLIKPHGELLGRAIDMQDPVCLVHQSDDHLPPHDRNLDPVIANSDWEPGLFGALAQVGLNPRIVHWDIDGSFENCKWAVLQDFGNDSPKLAQALRKFVSTGGVVVSFLKSRLAEDLGFQFKRLPQNETLIPPSLRWKSGTEFAKLDSEVFEFYELRDKRCEPLLYADAQTVGFTCGNFIQIGAQFYAPFNSGAYGTLSDLPERSELWLTLMKKSRLLPRVQTATLVPQLVAWGRRDQRSQWITVRNAAAGEKTARIRTQDALNTKRYRVLNTWTGSTSEVEGRKLREEGFPVRLEGFGIHAYRVDEL